MKKIFFLGGIILLIAACSTQKEVVKVEKKPGQGAAADSTKYELITFDSNFETWYKLHASEATDRSEAYYENWNRQYVIAWNIDAQTPGKRNFFEPIVGYDPTVNYGFELNRKLFYYFQYVENVLHIKIMDGGPNIVLN